MRRRKARICWLLMITGLVVILTTGLLMAKLGQSSLPRVLTHTFIAQVEKQAQVKVQLGRAQLVTPWHLVLYNVNISQKDEPATLIRMAGPIHISKIALHLNPLALLAGKWSTAIRSVDVVAPRGTLLVTTPNQVQQEHYTATKKQQISAGNGITFPQMQFTMREGNLIIIGANGQHTIWQQITGHGTITSHGWQLAVLRAENGQGDAVFKGENTIKGLNLTVRARCLHLPDAIPVVDTWGISGMADFNGNITGSISQPQLAGWLTLNKGTIWRQSIDNARGQVQIIGSKTTFDDVVIKKGQAIYQLAGQVNSTSANPSLNINLHSARGRAEQLLAVLNLPLPAKGEIDGDINFAGPLGQIKVCGNIAMQQGSIFDEPLDSLQGQFSWEDGQLYLDRTQARRATGTLDINGKLAVDGANIDLNMQISNWQVEKVPFLPAALLKWQGVLSASGRVSGSITNPVFKGDVLAQNIQKGSLIIKEVKGPINLVDNVVSSTNLVATTIQGGTWWLQGEVTGINSTPTLNVIMHVVGESLSSLLHMGGYKLPITLVDGVVGGYVRTSGQLGNLSTQLQLSLAQADNFADALQLDMLISERKIKRLHLS